MIDHKADLQKGIYLEDNNILIEWNISAQELSEKISKIKGFEVIENKDFNYRGYNIQSKILGFSDELKITFNFVNDRVTSINIWQQNVVFNIENNFNRIQTLLEERIGKPNGLSKVLSNIFKFKGERTCKWKIGRIEIVHSLFERDGLQESLEVKV